MEASMTPEGDSREIKAKIEEWLRDISGTTSSQECDKDLGFVTTRDKASRRQVFKRLVDAGRLMRIKSRTGAFKVIPQIEEVDKSKVDGTELAIGLPFGLEKYVRIFPKDIIVLAGVSNVGKTALMLNLAWKNKQFECWYFSSEMGAVKCKDTIGNFKEEPHFDGWPFHFVDDFEDYETIIRPDAINFIDYVEEEEGKYFIIPSIERAIQRRLNKGIAFIAIQKQPGHEYGLGGYNTIGKTALYITMDGGYPETTMTIKKAKTPRGGSVYGFKLSFTIDGGINLTSHDRWAREE